MEFWHFDESHWNKNKTILVWQIAMNMKIVIKLQVTAILGFHSLYDWGFQMM
jgi:hypothetical protein